MKIICIGRNYPQHAKELNNPIPEKPVFFLKPDTALLLKNRPFYIPDFSDNIHFEVEIVLKINRIGKHIEEKFAHRYYNQIGLGIDFTARDVQTECKTNGHPWEIAKAFDYSAPLGDFVDIKRIKIPDNINFQLYKNEELVQEGNSSEMLFSFDKLISYISQFMTLKIGDLIFTGTPSGVGKINVGDKLKGVLEDKVMFEFDIK